MNDNIFFFFYNLAHQSNFFDGVITFFAVYFIYIVILSALSFSFFYRKSPPDRMTPVIRAGWRELFLVCFSGGLAWGLAKILKILIHTPRPFEVFPQVQSLFVETGYAFPSGHTLVAGAIAFALCFINKKAGYLFLFFALLIGLSRIISGVHFPIDILGGFVLGALVAYFVKFFLKIYNYKHV